MTCKACEAPNREIWPPGRAPEMVSTGFGGNFMSLESCKICSHLWVSVYHEPYASFPYLIQWPFSEQDFSDLFQRDTGNTLHDWHQGEVNRLGPTLVGDDAAAIQAHFERSSGHEPYNNYRRFIPPDLMSLLGRA